MILSIEVVIGGKREVWNFPHPHIDEEGAKEIIDKIKEEFIKNIERRRESND